jgi:hypothetical protein
MVYDPTTPVGQVRLLINDTQDPPNQVFTTPEITGFLTLEGNNVKRAAAQAIDTIADDEALTSKVIKDHDLSTDGAKVADALRKRAAALRDQADTDDSKNDEAGFFEFVPLVGQEEDAEFIDWPWVP